MYYIVCVTNSEAGVVVDTLIIAVLDCYSQIVHCDYGHMYLGVKILVLCLMVVLICTSPN